MSEAITAFVLHYHYKHTYIFVYKYEPYRNNVTQNVNARTMDGHKYFTPSDK